MATLFQVDLSHNLYYIPRSTGTQSFVGRKIEGVHTRQLAPEASSVGTGELHVDDNTEYTWSR